MADYLSRPLCPWSLDYSESWSLDFQYPIEDRQIGAGLEFGIGTQTWAARKMDCVATVWGGTGEIEDFFNAIRGRSLGFWLALHYATADVLAVDGDALQCAGTELASRWGLTPRTHVLLISPDGTTYPTEATAAEASGETTMLTLAAMPTGAGVGWGIALLLYVRLAEDSVEFEEISLDTYKVEFSAIELPLEYETAGTPTASVYLYEVGYKLGSTENVQRFTSWGVSVLDEEGQVWTARPINHGDITDEMDGQSVSVEANSLDWSDCPFLDLFPRAGGLPMIFRIYEAQWDWETFRATGTPELLFDGAIQKPAREGTEINAKAVSGADLFTRELPTLIFSRSCQVAFCSGPCGLSASDYSISGTYEGALSSSGNSYIDVTAPDLDALGATWLVLGRVETPDCHDGVPSRDWEYRPILGITAQGSSVYRIHVRYPFSRLTTGQTVHLMAGCAKNPTACKTRVTADGVAVDNFSNFVGHPFVPLTPPQTNLDTEVTGGKKGGK